MFDGFDEYELERIREHARRQNKRLKMDDESASTSSPFLNSSPRSNQQANKLRLLPDQIFPNLEVINSENKSTTLTLSHDSYISIFNLSQEENEDQEKYKELLNIVVGSGSTRMTVIVPNATSERLKELQEGADYSYQSYQYQCGSGSCAVTRHPEVTDAQRRWTFVTLPDKSAQQLKDTYQHTLKATTWEAQGSDNRILGIQTYKPAAKPGK